MSDPLPMSVRGAFSDAELSVLHAGAFCHEVLATPWNRRVAENSLTWIVVRSGNELVGFINVLGDGGVHAVVLDLCVAAPFQGRGLGRALVEAAAREAKQLGCHWLHADYERDLVPFYEDSCGMRPTAAGLLKLFD